ncbi:MAG: TetR/AcrR family transcriptional regulator [Oligoflexia bacterium]|nr:TetR/AcrR family transcriptional regulator [Oligoflexia bacterium]
MRIKNKIDWKALTSMPGSKKLGEKKVLILDTALKIISEDGLQGLGVTRLSKETGLSKSLILYHYETMDRIIEDLFFFSGKMARYFIEKNYNPEHSFEQKTASMISALFEWVIYNKEVGEFFILMFHQSGKTPSMGEIQKYIFGNARELWERLFLESMRYNSLEEIRILVTGIMNMITGTLIMMVSTKDTDNYEEHIMTLKFNIESLLKVELPSIDL